MKNILIITTNWIMGGAEKVIINLSENISKDKYCFTLLILHKKDKENFLKNSFNYPMGIKSDYIENRNLFLLFISLISFIKKNKPDIILTVTNPEFASFIIFFNKLLHNKIKIIITFHNFFYKKKLKHYIYAPFRNFLIRKADYVISVSKELEKYIFKEIRISAEKIKTIYNPIINDNIINIKYDIPLEYKNFYKFKKILTVCRLDKKQKDFDSLFKAFFIIKKNKKDIKLFIIGDGPNNIELKNSIIKLNLENDIFLLGKKQNPYPYYVYSDVFVLSSFFEGLPTVIIEAMALGCPVISTDCPTGPKELIGDNENGILVPMNNPEKMAKMIESVLADKKLREKLILNAKSKIEEFKINKSIKKYEELFDIVLKN